MSEECVCVCVCFNVAISHSITTAGKSDMGLKPNYPSSRQMKKSKHAYTHTTLSINNYGPKHTL